MATVAVDGVTIGRVPVRADLRLDVAPVPSAFSEITLRIPLAARSDNGGTIRDGTVGNPHVSIDESRRAGQANSRGRTCAEALAANTQHMDGVGEKVGED